MRIHSAVKTPFLTPGRFGLAAAALAAAMAMAESDIPVLPDDGSERPWDERTEALLRILRPPAEVKVFEVAGSMTSASIVIRITLHEHRLQVYSGTDLAIECPISHGRASSATAEGEYAVTEKLTEPRNLNYGHFRTPQGAMVLRGVFAKLDPLPPEAVFDPVVPRFAFKLSDDGPLVFAGEATGAATTDGSIVVPDRVAGLLHEKLAPGVKVIIDK